MFAFPFIFGLYEKVSPVSAQGAGLLLLSVVTKVSKNTLVPVVRKYSKSPRQFGSVFSSLQFLLTLGIGNKSLLIGDFEVSALCFSSALNRTVLFKTASLKCVRWSLPL